MKFILITKEDWKNANFVVVFLNLIIILGTVLSGLIGLMDLIDWLFN